MINNEQISAYREMAKNAGENSMEAQIRANLEATCDKFAGNEDKFDRCMAFLVNCAKEILEGKNGEIPDEVCFRICRDYFNDEIWKAEDEEKAKKEESSKKKTEESAAKKAEADAKKRAAEEKKKTEIARKKAEEEAKKQAAILVKKKAEEEKKAELERKQAKAANAPEQGQLDLFASMGV